jgi:hypothetical protein
MKQAQFVLVVERDGSIFIDYESMDIRFDGKVIWDEQLGEWQTFDMSGLTFAANAQRLLEQKLGIGEWA